MKKVVFLFICCLVAVTAFGQETNTAPQTLSQEQRDSILTQIGTSVAYMNLVQSAIGRYKVYPTTNTYTSLKLDTASGKITALQIGLGKDTATMEYEITGAIIEDEVVIGRYELYPTNNMYNFILLDTAMGAAFQVQWNTDKEKCGRWRMW